MNSNKRDIYFDGRIYQDVPDGMSRYNYGAVPIQGDHPFTNMEDVTGRYELKKCNCKIGVDCPFTKSKWFSTCTIAIPLPTPAPVAEPVICVKCKQIYLKEPACNCGECGGKTFEKTHQSNAQFAVAELPKDAEGKAKELMEKFLTKVGQECEHDSYCDKPECCYNGIVHCVVNLDIAKQCALICVDEILNCKHGWNKETSSFVTYWQQVRTAINQL